MTLARGKTIFLYRFLPVLLAFIFVVFLLSECFTPSAKAVAVVDDIIIGGTIVAWLAGLGISLSSSLGSSEGSRDSFVKGLKELCDDFDTFNSNVQGFFWSQILGGISDIAVLANETGQFFLEIGDSVVSSLGDFGEWIVDEFSLVSGMSSPTTLFTDSGLFFTDGSKLLFNPGTSFSSTASTFFLGGSSRYTLINGNYFEVSQHNIMSFYSDNVLIYQTSLSDQCSFFQFRDRGANISPQVLGFKSNAVFQGATSLWSSYSSYENWISGASGSLTVDGLGRDVLGGLDIPDSNDYSGYVSIPGTVTDSLPANPSLDDYLGGVLDDALTAPITNIGSYADAYVAELSDTIPSSPSRPEPNSVELPLIGIVLPSDFSLGLSSIWHYVRTWVTSLSSWFSWMFGVFASLPYAMVVPIYASAVIVIVLGMYKRFFM